MEINIDYFKDINSFILSLAVDHTNIVIFSFRLKDFEVEKLIKDLQKALKKSNDNQ